MRRSRNEAFRSAIVLLTLIAVLLPSNLIAAQSSLPDLPSALDIMLRDYYLPSVTVGLGSFTFSDTQLPTPFSRWFEDELRIALSRTSAMKLFDKQVAAAMDPSIRALYKDFFGADRVDTILYGKYAKSDEGVAVTMSLTGLSTGSLIAETKYLVPIRVIPSNYGILPSTQTTETAVSLAKMLPGTAAFTLSLSADRGIGATYRDGETLELYLTSSKDAYLKIYHVDVNGVAQLIWPNRYGGSGRILAGQAMKFPGVNDGFKYLLGKPYGTEYIKAIASTNPFKTMEADFTDLSGTAPAAITRGLSVVSTADVTRAEALVVYEILP